MSDSALIDDLERQFAENPRRVFARLANEYRKAGDAEHAIEICRSHVPQQPGYISGHIVLGQALFDTSRFDEAKSAFETALGLDPENLIALRQLGDIARETGDRDDARSWYRRLLEVDPQNEEIAAQLSTLDASADATPDVPAPDAGVVPDEAPVSWGDIHPEGVSTEPEPPAPGVASHDVALEVEQAFPTMFATNPPAGAWEGEAHDSSHDSPIDADPATIDLDRESRDEKPVVWEDDAVAPLSRPEPTSTDDAVAPPDLPDVPAADTFVEVMAVSEHVPSWSSERVYEEPSAEAAPPTPADDVDTPSADPTATPVSNDAELPDAFVTETMADLYVQQGFNERALDVYLHLAERYPEDSRFQEQIAALQETVAAAQVESTSSAAAVPDDEDDWRGERAIHSEPTIRAFLSAIAARRAKTAPSEWTPGSGGGGEAGDVEVVAAPPVAAPPYEESPGYEEPAPRADLSTYEEPTAHEEPSVDAAASDAQAASGLFPGWTVSPEDAAAGSALADAYADDVHGGDGRDGTPAHRAIDELSLDAVFRDAPGRDGSRHDGPSVSFDEFFADDDGRGHDMSSDASTGNARGEAGASADLELFHAWLEGLKK